MKSMTGMGRAHGKVRGVPVKIEIKTVNHRYCEVNLRVPSRLGFLEIPAQQAIKAKLHRGKIDVFVGGAGTGGTLSGVGRYLKEKNSNIKVVMADPRGSILHDLFYHKKIVDPPHSYKVEGVGEDMLPQNVHFQYMNDVVQVDDRSAFLMTRQIVNKEGICVGPSSALALVAAMDYAKKLDKPSKILVLFPDSGRSYLSKAFNDAWMRDNGFLPSPLKAKTVEDLILSRSNSLILSEINLSAISFLISNPIPCLRSYPLKTRNFSSIFSISSLIKPLTISLKAFFIFNA